ncbi:MAG: two-component sensor histidine kinase [Bacteroidetes bacterium]|nr:two-component sensor histidine kinase [Bacteroidota bacterium]
MNSGDKKSRPLFIFYVLVAYVFLQFSWWTYSMFQLNNEISTLKTELNLLKGESPEDVIQKGNEINERLHKRWIMISSEGAFFIGLLLLGIYQIRKTFKKESELANQQKNFLLSVTHELKSPIASAKLQLQTLEKRELSREKQLEIIQNAIADTERLNTLVENILLAARIDNSVYSINKEECDLSALTQDILLRTIHSSDHKQRIIFKIDSGIKLRIDRNSYPSILLNLVENAIKYAPADSEIIVSLKQNGQKIILSVIDQGSGIPEQEKENIFQKFYRIGSEETRRTKGTGLGLYIVNYIVTLHNGTIAVKSNTPKGSIFEVTFYI